MRHRETDVASGHGHPSGPNQVDSILSVLSSNVVLPAKYNIFVRLEFSTIVRSQAFQLPARLVFNHFEPPLKDRELSIFGFD